MIGDRSLEVLPRDPDGPAPIVAGYCNNCGAEIVEDDYARQGPDGELYCCADCAAEALTTEVIARPDGAEPTGNGPLMTVDQAFYLAERHIKVCDRLRDRVASWRRMARTLREQGAEDLARCYESCANDAEDALKMKSPAGGSGAAGDR